MTNEAERASQRALSDLEALFCAHALRRLDSQLNELAPFLHGLETKKEMIAQIQLVRNLATRLEDSLPCPFEEELPPPRKSGSTRRSREGRTSI